jgi:hypothetical protein
VAVDSNDHVYVCDFLNSNVQVFKWGVEVVLVEPTAFPQILIDPEYVMDVPGPGSGEGPHPHVASRPTIDEMVRQLTPAERKEAYRQARMLIEQGQAVQEAIDRVEIQRDER